MTWKRRLYKEALPLMAMVSVEFTNVGVNILFKAASLKGMSSYVYIVYSHAIATLLLIPLPFIFRRTLLPAPSLKLPLLFRICGLALVGFLAQIAGTEGIIYTSATLASAMSSLTPAFTFILAVIFRIEKLTMSSSTSRAKIIGTIISIAGALVVVLYKGPTILSTAYRAQTISHTWPLFSTNSNWIIGGALLAITYFLYSFWYILQSQILKICPNELLVTFAYTFFVTIISAPVCFLAEKNLDAWRLKLDIASVSIIYSAIFGTCYSTTVHLWGVRLKGPIYVAIFKPLSIAIAAIIGVIFLGDSLRLGIVIGAVVISMGFYGVIWGNANEERSSPDHGINNIGHLSDEIEKVPLMQNYINIEDV